MRKEALGLSSLLVYGSANLHVFRKFAGDFLRIDFLTVGEDLEATVIVGGEGKLTDALFVCSEQLFRQTDGFRFVSSRCTVFDTNVHINLLTVIPVPFE